MTKREKVVVSAYTGDLMCNLDDLQKYAENKLNRKVCMKEFSEQSIWDELREKSKFDFGDIICAEDD